MFTVEKSALSTALALVEDVADRKGSIPILKNLMIAPSGDKLMATATNLDVEASVSFKAEIEPGFKGFTVPASLLKDFTGKLADGEIKFSGSQTEIRVSQGRSRVSLQCLPTSDFPSMNTGAMTATIDMPADQLLAAIGGVSFATSTEETRYYLDGIYFHRAEIGGEPRLTLVATDGHRLAKRVLSIEDAVPDFAGVIIPRSALKVFAKQLARHDRVTVEVSDQQIRMTTPDSIVTSKLIDGTFPDYARVIPVNNGNKITLDGATMSKAIDRVTTVSSEKGNAVKLAFVDGKLTLSVRNPDAGDAEEEIQVEAAEDVSIGFNGKYVLDALAQIGDGTLELALSDAGSPALLTKSGQTDDLIVLMPMRV